MAYQEGRKLFNFGGSIGLDSLEQFKTKGPSWSERASLGGLDAVLAPGDFRRSNLFLHGINTFGAQCALKYSPRDSSIIDFGCGTGRFTTFFDTHRRKVLATEVTPEMLEQAKKECGE